MDGSEEALGWLAAFETGETEALAPDLIFAEVAHSLLRHVRVGLLLLEEARAAMSAITALPIDTPASRTLAEAALAVAVDRGVTAYDAHYLALAEAEEAVLVTADRRLADVASRSVLLE